MTMKRILLATSIVALTAGGARPHVGEQSASGDRAGRRMARRCRVGGDAEIREAASRAQSEIEIRPDVPSAIVRARELAEKNGIVVVTGSIYIVGEATRALGVSVDGK